MPGRSIESVNSTSARNVGDWSQEGDFVKGTKTTAFVFLRHVVVYAGQRIVNRRRVQKR